jgi:uncharacterized protein YggE
LPHTNGSAAEDAGITVSGTGEVLAKPNRLELELVVTGAAELTGDALVKYNDAVRRTLQAYEQLGMKNLQIEPRAVSFASVGGVPEQPFARGVGADTGAANLAKAQIGISRSLRVVLTGIRELPEAQVTEAIGKLVDTAKDSGVAIGNEASNALVARMMGQMQSPEAMVTFVVDDVVDLRDKAYQQAFDDARARASRLATLAGAELGPVVAVEQTVAEMHKEENLQMRMMAAIYGVQASTSDESRLTSTKLGDIPVRVALRVRFALKERSSQ